MRLKLPTLKCRHIRRDVIEVHKTLMNTTLMQICIYNYYKVE